VPAHPENAFVVIALLFYSLIFMAFWGFFGALVLRHDVFADCFG
jgi:hypothetical protein